MTTRFITSIFSLEDSRFIVWDLASRLHLKLAMYRKLCWDYQGPMATIFGGTVLWDASDLGPFLGFSVLAAVILLQDIVTERPSLEG